MMRVQAVPFKLPLFTQTSFFQEEKEQQKTFIDYTSYFAKVKSLPKEVVPISICGKSPSGWTGLEYKKLAPKWSFFQEWKKTGDNHFYIQHFQEEVLDHLSQEMVWGELKTLSHSLPFALVCYEKPGDFCHRHLVADWLRKKGYRIAEFI